MYKTYFPNFLPCRNIYCQPWQESKFVIVPHVWPVFAEVGEKEWSFNSRTEVEEGSN